SFALNRFKRFQEWVFGELIPFFIAKISHFDVWSSLHSPDTAGSTIAIISILQKKIPLPRDRSKGTLYVVVQNLSTDKTTS
ncbi:MAG TPA: hypothetical protein VGA43_04650, partial [Deferrimonas sp.]